MTPLRIAHMTSGHEAHDTRIVKKQCADLAARGHEVFLVCRAQQEATQKPMPAGVTHVPVARPGGRFDRFVGTARAVRKVARALDPDIYHFHDPELLPHGITLARAGKAVVYDVHEDYRASLLNRGWIPKPLRAVMAKRVARLEDRMQKIGWCVPATPDIASHFEKDRSALVQNYPSLREFKEALPADPTVRPPRLVYVGAITQERGIFEMLDALPILTKTWPDLRFDLIGPCSDALLAELRQRPGWAATDFHGLQDRMEVVAHLAQAQVGLCILRDVPRYRVSQPTKLYEYMAAGLPVVASDFPLWKTLVGDAIGVFATPSPEGLAAGVAHILSNPSSAVETGRKSRAMAMEQFSWEVECDRLEALYQKAVTGQMA